ncbi:hypothetical protein KZZ52_21075 [Dactylosporangium sp. AC04546]|uniref:hypothetical protein n=1 Tax=Dactylosporangium sp. AC04546 TaxID=2862460 RepID=UPI001EE0DF6D|nr:hypothetical protein [Dactylosporangium sp. AC04546]WVK87780.1 hypothetical protein KZZ52_21075 [Dactylosporangium sp. AC04546]
MRVYKVVELATSDAPPLRQSVDEIIERGERARRRRRTALATASAAAAVLAVVGLAAVARLGTPTEPEPPLTPAAGPLPDFPQPSSPFEFTISGYQVGRFRVGAPTGASAAYQRAPIYADGATTKVNDTTAPVSVAELVVYRPGAFAADRLTNTRPATVAGRDALQYTNEHGLVLAWQYTTGGWATVNGGGPNRYEVSIEELEDIAAGLRPGEPTPARVPFTLSYVPAGYRAVEVSSGAYPGPQLGLDPAFMARGGALFSNPLPEPRGLTGPWNYGFGPVGGFTISLIPNSQSNYPLKPGEAKNPRCPSEALCHAWNADGSLQIEIVGDGRLPDAELLKILNGLTLVPSALTQ